LGLALSVPTFIVGLTAVLITFQDGYKNKPNEPEINVSWLPGYSVSLIKNEVVKKSNEIRASITTEDNTRYLGTSYGLFAFTNGSYVALPEFNGYEVHCLQQSDSLLWIGSKKGLYAMVLPNGELKQMLDKDIHHIEIQSKNSLVVSDNKSLYVSKDFGKVWRKDNAIQQIELSQQQIASLKSTKTQPLHKFIMDLHTGKAFFGKTYEAIWILLVGLSVTLLSFTGFYMWYRKKRKKTKSLRS
jgi:LPXTG-motif cell wall-anchored protein